jgi:orotate phosphoribosyltransferase
VTDLADAVARELLRVGAVALRPEAPFTWASGRLSPIYCDNRLTLADPALRRLVADRFAEVVRGQGVASTAVAGTATAGIPHATLLADRLGLPLVYVRSEAKAHGRGQRIEGRLEAGARVALVEDTISTGGSSLSAAEALREAGATVTALVALFTYGFPAATEAFAAAGLPVATLTDYDALLARAIREGRVTPEDLAALREWRADPGAWSAARGGAP